MVLADTEPINDSKLPQTVEKSLDLELSGTPLRTAVTLDECKFTAIASIRSPETNEDEDADVVDDDSRAPVILVAVVDKSGSMAGSKMTSLKETLNFIIKQMTKRDKLAIVEYDTNVSTTLPLTTMDNSGKDRATAVTTALKTGSATNLSGGLLEGLRLIPTDVDSKCVVSTLLLTDGLANHGIRSTKGIISMINSNHSKGIGRCIINTFGFGKDHDATMLTDISNAAEGMYYFIENADTIATAFADCLAGLLTVTQQGIELTIEACSDVTIDKVHGSKPATIVEPGKVYRVNLGDLQEGEERDIPFDFTIPSGSACDKYDLAKLSVSYFDVKAEEMKENSTTISIARAPIESHTEEQKSANLQVDRHHNRVKAADATEVAIQLADKGKVADARELLQKTIAEIKASVSSNDPLSISIIAGLQESLASLVDKVTYQRTGQYAMNGYNKAWKMQRCNAQAPQAPQDSLSALLGQQMLQQQSQECASPSFSTPAFETKSRARMKKKFTKK